MAAIAVMPPWNGTSNWMPPSPAAQKEPHVIYSSDPTYATSKDKEIILNKVEKEPRRERLRRRLAREACFGNNSRGKKIW